MYRVVQFSDTHFAAPGHQSHGGFGYDTTLAWERTSARAFDGSIPPDAVVITGDLVDQGLAEEYEIAVDLLRRIEAPANLLPGNHDFDEPLRQAFANSNVTMERAQHVGQWQFLFLDSNGEFGETEDRIASNGWLGDDELEWIEAQLDQTKAPHTWLWMHHPPAMYDTWAHSPVFDAQIEKLLMKHRTIRGIGAGHVHVNMTRTIADRPVVVCPALTINFDLVALTTMPPGFRTWTFADDGTFETECHLATPDDAWPHFELPQPVIDYQRGQLPWDELQAYMTELMDAFG